MKTRAILMAGMMAAALPAQADTINLDFGGHPVEDGGTGTYHEKNFSDTEGVDLVFSNVATGINATLTKERVFDSGFRNNNGAVNGDIRVNVDRLETARFTLSLWDATVGDGFSTLYDPGTAFEWSLGFYDVDGGSEAYDVVTVLSEGVYTVTESTILMITEDYSEKSVRFSGENSGAVPGQFGLEPPLTQAQADVSFILTMENTSQVVFEYEVGLRPGEDPEKANGRNLLIDGGGLTTALDPFDPIEAPTPAAVPLPGSLALFGGAIGLLALRRRR